MLSRETIYKAKRQNRQAQQEIYYHTVDLVKQVAWRYCPNVQDTQDIMQSTYLNVFRYLKSFDEERGNLRGWIHSIAVNEALRFIKKKQSHSSLVEISLTQEPHVAFNWAALTFADLIEAMSKLTEPQRLLVNMYFIDDMSYPEISKALAVKESTIRANVSRLRKEVKRTWATYNDVNLK